MKKLTHSNILLLVVICLSTTAFAQQNQVQSPLNFKSKGIQKTMPAIPPQANNELTIDVRDGAFTANFTKQEVTKQEVVSKFNQLFKLDGNNVFLQMSEKTDELGITHSNYAQYYMGIRVEGVLVMLHNKNGILKSMNGNFAPLKHLDIQANISDIQSVELAKQALNVTTLTKEYPVELVFAKNPVTKQYVLAKKVKIENLAKLIKYNVFVDAKTGEIVNKLPLIYHTDVTATGTTYYSGTQTFTTDSFQVNGYKLLNNAQKIHTFDGTNWDGYSMPTTYYTNSINTWDRHYSLDVHWGIEKTLSFYKNILNRNSYDNMGSPVYSIVNPVVMGEDMRYNAAYAGDGIMLYGRGGNSYSYGNYGPFVDIDVTGHELTHGVTDANGNGGLNYQGESGALNESFSDIFAMCVENYAGVLSWLVGENVMLDPPHFMRSMSNPNSGAYPQPDTYMGNYWANPNSWEDSGGVHINSGIQNFWFYLLCNGGSGTNDKGNDYSVNGIGINNAQKISYRNLMNYLTPSADHIDAFYGSMHAAEDLFGNPSAQLESVQKAWYAVGIDSTTTSIKPACNFEVFTAPTGTLSDGSGYGSPYQANTYCQYFIQPTGATQITLNFTRFDTEAGYDFVRVYDFQGHLLGEYSGQLAPFSISTSEGMGAMYIVFSSDDYIEGDGWEANYTSKIDNNQNYCSGEKYLTEAIGTLSDGGKNQYYSGMQCIWTIAQPNAREITLEFSKLNLGNGNDVVVVFDAKSIDDIIDDSQLLGEFYGNTLPNKVTAKSGGMVVAFFSDYGQHGTGWVANYYTDSVEDIGIYPNPIKSTNEMVSIYLKTPTKNVKIGVYDLMGKMINFIELNEQEPLTNYKMSVNEIPNGLYIVRVDANKTYKTTKLIIGR